MKWNQSPRLPKPYKILPKPLKPFPKSSKSSKSSRDLEIFLSDLVSRARNLPGRKKSSRNPPIRRALVFRSPGPHIPKKYYRWDAWFRNRWFQTFLDFSPFSNLLNRMTIFSANLAHTHPTSSLARTLRQLPLGCSPLSLIQIDGNSWISIKIQRISKDFNRKWSKIEARGFQNLTKSFQNLTKSFQNLWIPFRNLQNL